MSTISVEDIQRDPASFLARIEAGESFVIVRDAQAVAEVTPAPSRSSELRPYGLARGQFLVPKDFNEPLLEDVF